MIEKIKTGASRENKDGKGRYDLLPPRAMHRLAQRFEFGAKKYSDRDWENGIPISKLLDSALRHIFQYMRDDKNEDHLSAAVWNLLAIIEERELIKERKLPASLKDKE
jgi:hypothetical protein